MKLSQHSPIRSNEPFWQCAYYSGCGNCFLVAFDPDNVHEMLNQEERASIALQTKEVVDGLLFLGLNRSSLRMHYFNSDGSRASMCGNGLRCLGLFASRQYSELSPSFTIITDVGPRKITLLSDNEIEADMGAINKTHVLSYPQEPLYLTDTGVPHALIVRPILPTGPIEDEARPLRFHTLFGKEGANISYATYSTQENKTVVFLRTYERGVERETGACGTGACAAAIILHNHYNCPFPFVIHFASQETARVTRQENRVFLTASASHIDSYVLKNPLV